MTMIQAAHRLAIPAASRSRGRNALNACNAAMIVTGCKRTLARGRVTFVLRERVSQAVFANYLKVTPNLVSKWERGEKRPSGPALKLLSLVRGDSRDGIGLCGDRGDPLRIGE